MSTPHPEPGPVVVIRSVSVDGYIAGPGDDMSWVLEALRENPFPEAPTATGAMLVGRRTHEVSRTMAAADTEYDGGPVFVLTHQPPDPPHAGVTFLTGDLEDAVATARAAAGGKALEVLGADLASQCLQRGLVDEVLVYLVPVLLGDGVRFSTSGLGRVDLETLEVTRSGPVTMLRFAVRGRGVGGRGGGGRAQGALAP